MTPSQTIARIAEIASDFAESAGIGACETAGLFVSVLSAHPEFVESFLEGGVGYVLDNDSFRWEFGALSWQSTGAGIVTPAELRSHIGRKDQ